VAADTQATRRRVFFVLDSLDEDDVGDHVATLLGRLSRRRFEPRVVTLKGEGPLAARIRAMRVTVHALPDGGRMDPVLAVPRLRRILTRLGADLVHAFHHVSGALSELSAPANVPVVRYVPRLRSPADPFVIRLAGAMEGLAARHRGVRFVVGTDDARVAVAEYYGVDRVAVVPECVDAAGLRSELAAIEVGSARLRLGLREGEETLVCCTAFHDEPFVEALLHGFSMARLERPGLRLFLLGAGPAESRARVLAEALHLADAVVFLGGGPASADLWTCADVVVDASPWPGLSRQALKAASVGLPVLKWQKGAGSGDAALSPPRVSSAPEFFAGEVTRVLGDALLSASIRESVAKIAEASAVSLVAERWASLYDDVLAGVMREP